jgi:hypothetical protein
MRKPVTLLSLVILALGASTAWLAFQLHTARQELADLRGSAPDTGAAPIKPIAEADRRAPDMRALPVAAATQTPGKSAPPGNTRQLENDAAMHSATLTHNAWVRTWIDDPERRARVLSDYRKSHEKEFPSELLDLDDDAHNQLLDTLAASDLRYAEALYRCNSNPACDIRTTIGTETQANKRELTALIGADKAQRLENYRDNYMERNSVATFRSELPDSMRMSDAQAEKLVDALGEERRRMINEWQERDAQISGMANMYGSLTYPSTAMDVQQRVAEASEYQRRQRARAAEGLTSAQLDMFTKQQEQMLEIARGSWEYEDKSVAGR